MSQRIRKRVEEIFGWMKTVGGLRRTRYRGIDKTGLAGYLVATAYNLVRMAKLVASQQEDTQVTQAGGDHALAYCAQQAPKGAGWDGNRLTTPRSDSIKPTRRGHTLAS